MDRVIDVLLTAFCGLGIAIISIVAVILALLVISLPFLFLSACALGLFKIIQFLIGMP